VHAIGRACCANCRRRDRIAASLAAIAGRKGLLVSASTMLPASYPTPGRPLDANRGEVAPPTTGRACLTVAFNTNTPHCTNCRRRDPAAMQAGTACLDQSARYRRLATQTRGVLRPPIAAG